MTLSRSQYNAAAARRLSLRKRKDQDQIEMSTEKRSSKKKSKKGERKEVKELEPAKDGANDDEGEEAEVTVVTNKKDATTQRPKKKQKTAPTNDVEAKQFQNYVELRKKYIPDGGQDDRVAGRITCLNPRCVPKWDMRVVQW